MNREDAIKVLKSLMECLSIDCDDDCEHCHIQLDGITAVVEACAIAVTELSQIDTDTISRGAAIEAVKNALDPNIVSFVKAKIAIENLPPAPDPRWTQCSKKLPEDEGRYLCYISNDPYGYTMCCDYLDGGWYPDSETASNNVVAWMPLPK